MSDSCNYIVMKLSLRHLIDVITANALRNPTSQSFCNNRNRSHFVHFSWKSKIRLFRKHVRFFTRYKELVFDTTFYAAQGSERSIYGSVYSVHSRGYVHVIQWFSLQRYMDFLNALTVIDTASRKKQRGENLCCYVWGQQVIAPRLSVAGNAIFFLYRSWRAPGLWHPARIYLQKCNISLVSENYHARDVRSQNYKYSHKDALRREWIMHALFNIFVVPSRWTLISQNWSTSNDLFTTSHTFANGMLFVFENWPDREFANMETYRQRTVIKFYYEHYGCTGMFLVFLLGKWTKRRIGPSVGNWFSFVEKWIENKWKM